ncbi:MAG: amidohydrolase family protein [Myxococcota bacterium]
MTQLIIRLPLVLLLLALACGDDDGVTPPIDGGDPDGGVDMDMTMMGDDSIDMRVPPDGGPNPSELFPPPQIVDCAAETGRPAPTPGAELCTVTSGDASMLITATVLRPGEVLRGGQVLVGTDGTIQCAACDCTGSAAGATVLECPEAVLSPGLINAHDHITFGNTVPYAARGNFTDERFEHRHDWRTGGDEHTRVSSGGGRARTEEMQWLELRQLFSGTTSINGSGGPEGLLRNLDNNNRNGLSLPAADYSTFPLGDSDGTKIESGCAYDFSDDVEDATGENAYVPHVAEGIDQAARNEFLCIQEGQRDLVQPRSAFIHGVGLNSTDISQFALDGTKLIWSPRTNITLYGDTARVTEYARQGVVIGLGTDWIATGSMHMGRELACADSFNQTYLNGFFPDEQLWLMATENSAISLGVDSVLGSIDTGKLADLALFDAREHRDHRAVLMADEGDVALVMREGVVLFGDASIVDSLESGCNAVDVCGVSKSVCLGEIGTTFEALEGENVGEYQLAGCGAPPDEPSCLPFRNAMGSLPDPEQNGSNRYTGMSSPTDMDGDGIEDAVDNCPNTFNPVRPLDNGAQADVDSDSIGDACDPCPIGGDDDPATCNAVDPNDRDNDGVPNGDDNCPNTFNDDQMDMDADGAGDLCDACPDRANPGGTACPATVYEVQGGTFEAGATVQLSNLTVTAVARNGFYAQYDPGADGFEGVDFSGIFLFTGSAPDVSDGDVVDVSGAVGEFFGQTQLAGVSVTETGTRAPIEPLPVADADIITDGPRARALQSVLVSVNGGTVSSTPPGGGDVFVLETGLRVGDQLIDIDPPPGPGDELTFIAGPLNFGFENTRIAPRRIDDVVFASLRIGPTSTRVVQDATFELTVVLPAAAPAGGSEVTIAIDPAGLASGPGTITVPSGSFSASAIYTAGATPGAGTITASFGGEMVMASVEVTEPFSGGLIISEYVEGTSNNKALELFNGAGSVDLSACVINRFTNGASSPSSTLDLSGTLNTGETLVVCNGSFAMTDLCDVESGVINHNGDDAYTLVCDDMLIDSFGQVGTDPGDAWEGGGLSTQDRTLRRQCDAMVDIIIDDAFDPSVQYDGFDRDDFSGLGSHCE